MTYALNKRSFSDVGRVYWITGLPGAGKTTQAELLYTRLRGRKDNVVLLDGDRLRVALDVQKDRYSLADRLHLSMCYARLCQMLSLQGQEVVCATVSMFHTCRDWNRINCANYYEIFIDALPHVLRQRNQKGLYSRSERGQVEHVVGIDLPYEKPKQPDYIIKDRGIEDPEALFTKLWESIPHLRVERI